MTIQSTIIGIAALAGAASTAPAQLAHGGGTVDGGRGTSTGGTITQRGTIGQPDAGLLGGGAFSLSGGFWSRGATPCPADMDDGSGTGHPDGAVTIDDLLYFLGAYEGGTIAADLDDGSGLGHPDGAVTIDDLLFFLAHYEGGC